jgi:hypothetical protein
VVADVNFSYRAPELSSSPHTPLPSDHPRAAKPKPFPLPTSSPTAMDTATEKTAEDIRRELLELQRQHREVSLSLLSPTLPKLPPVPGAFSLTYHVLLPLADHRASARPPRPSPWRLRPRSRRASPASRLRETGTLLAHIYFRSSSLFVHLTALPQCFLM